MFGAVSKIVVFEQNTVHQVLVQYSDAAAAAVNPEPLALNPKPQTPNPNP